MPKYKTLFFIVTISSLMMMASYAAALDGNFYLGGQLGQARGEIGSAEMNKRMARLGYDAHARVSDQSRAAWEFVGGYQYSEYLALEAGYLDLGKVRTRLSGSPTDIQDYLNNANLVHPRSASGYELAISGQYPFDEKNSIYLRGGFLFSGSSYKADAQTEFAKRKSEGSTGFIGLGYAYEINARWVMRLSANSYSIEKENIKLIGIGLFHQFRM